METIYRDYAPQGVEFFYLYKALAHPELDGYINPITIEERLLHVREAERRLGSAIPWICDTMSNDLKHAIGNAPNSEYVLDPEGRILRMRAWSRPSELRADLEELVGAVENPTQLSELDLKTAPPPKYAPTGVVPRLKREGRYRAVIAKPRLEKTESPFYVKLRAEADQGLLRDGKGKLYLGFFLDPLYGVHWNNLAPEMDVEIIPPEGVTATPEKMKGPKVSEEADADPREFLVEIARGEVSDPARLRFRYFACTEEWCKPVTQEYLIYWQADPDAGRPTRPGARGRSGGPRGRGGFSEMLSRNDADGDGRLSRDEAPEMLARRFDGMDQNSDGYIDQEEMAAMRGRSGGPRGRGGLSEMLSRNDADGDGRLSRDEAPEQLARRFDAMDQNGDGYVDQEEMAAMRRRFGGRGR